MFINPKTAIQEGWVKFPEWMSEEEQQKCVGGNALDFTIDHLYTINDELFFISEKSKTMRSNTKIEPSWSCQQGPDKGCDSWRLEPGKCYDAMSDFFVNVPEGVAAYLITRSTFNRNGVFIQSGLYDQNFHGNCGFVIYNMGGHTEIVPHTRIGQLIFVKSESSGILYAGGYSTKEGQHWSTK